MASVIKPSLHKRIFLMMLAFSWATVFCFVGYQYLREKEFKSEFLNAQLQQYNRHLLKAMDQDRNPERHIAEEEKPFDNLRVSIITFSGSVIYDNILPYDSLDNHRDRPEIAQAMEHGTGFHIGRQSSSDGKEYFYSATRGEYIVVRTAIPYSNSLRDLLRTDWTFLAALIIIGLAMSILAYFTTYKLGKDIEQLNRYESEQERSRIKRQLTNNINHELKTPVASIQVCLETLLSGISLSGEKRQELIERCYTHNERLRRLLNDVSLITRMEDGGHLISREQVVVNHIIDEIAGELNTLPENERMTLHTNFIEEVTVDGNLSLIGSIFSNLTENAIAYSEGQNIHITLLENNTDICRIRFEDDGKGVGEEQLPHLFERFYRVDKGRSRKKGGTGLGLAIVKHAVLFHGGTIHVSNRPDGGLRFDFSLKKHNPQPQQSRTAATE